MLDLSKITPFKYPKNIKMSNKSIFLWIFVLFFLVVFVLNMCNEKDTVAPEEEINLNYPTVINALPDSEIVQLQNKFDSLTNSQACTELNQYGFTDNHSFCRAFRTNHVSQDSAFKIAAAFLLKFSEFTNVKDSIELFSSHRHIVYLENRGWHIVLGPQIYHGYEVIFAWIYIIVSGDQVYYIDNHWYSDIYIPKKFKIDKESAKKRLIGEKITFYGEAGNPLEFVITNESISDSMTTAIYPLDKKDSIELRVTWKIPILFSKDDIGWHVCVDVMTGEIVLTIQEFQTI